MKCCLFLNGEVPSQEIIPDLTCYSKCLAADGAFNYLTKMNIEPDLVLGDFDSYENPRDRHRFVELEDQDYSDFEKILQYLLKSFPNENVQVDIFGANGKESDHFLGNLSVAKKYISHLELKFFDNYRSYFLSNQSLDLRCKLSETVSILPFPQADEVSTEGLKYPLKKERLELGDLIAIRNEAIAEQVRIDFTEGTIIIFRGPYEF